MPETPEHLQNPPLPPSVNCPSCGAACPLTGVEEITCEVCGTRFKASDAIIDAEPISSPEEDKSLPPEALSNRTPSARKSAEQLLLDRLIQEPATVKQTPIGMIAIIIVVILVAGIGIYYATRDKEKFGALPPGMVDSTEMLKKHIVAQGVIDSLKLAFASNPNDPKAHLAMANAYYDAEEWGLARVEYASYLAKEPRDVGARVDYAFSMAQTDSTTDAALVQIDSALIFEPAHANALFNGGILAIRSVGADHKAGLSRARGYFVRARDAAASNPEMVKQIDRLLSEMDSVAMMPAAKK